jgi:tetratricopeptide (TPR) repeat protein
METQVKAALMAGLIGIFGVILNSMIPYWLEPTPPLKNITTINQMPSLDSLVSDLGSPRVAGASITWTATANNPGHNTLYFKYLLKNPLDDDFKPQTDWIIDTKWIWNTTEADIGKNEIQVWIKDGRHSVDALKGDNVLTKPYIITDSAASLNGKGMDLVDKNKYDDAIKAFNEAIRIDPSYVPALDNKGYVLNKQGKYDDAIEAFDEAIRIDPSYVPALDNKGIALNGLGRTTEAEAALAMALLLRASENYRSRAAFAKATGTHAKYTSIS